MPAVAVRAGRGTKVPVLKALGWGRQVQPTSRERKTEVAKAGA